MNANSKQTTRYDIRQRDLELGKGDRHFNVKGDNISPSFSIYRISRIIISSSERKRNETGSHFVSLRLLGGV